VPRQVLKLFELLAYVSVQLELELFDRDFRGFGGQHFIVASDDLTQLLQFQLHKGLLVVVVRYVALDF
jgi:hypothetical protein